VPIRRPEINALAAANEAPKKQRCVGGNAPLFIMPREEGNSPVGTQPGRGRSLGIPNQPQEIDFVPACRLQLWITDCNLQN